jgi:mannose-6-phosphate isomerase-like protein (cupin superfamily)
MKPGMFETKMLPSEFDVTAPDGSGIRVLARTSNGSMAHGTLAPGSTSLAIRHRTVEEIWFVLAGAAEIWRKLDDSESVTHLVPGISITIPLGTEFQFRTVGTQPFQFIMCTMPPWPDADEAIHVTGIW